MATGGLYGNSGTGALVATPGAESSGLYGNTTSFGGTYFEWFVFQVADTQPATPTGGSWNFTTNANTPPSGWTSTPPVNPLNTVWVSIALVSSRNTDALVWSVPGKFAYASGLPVLSGSGVPGSGVGQSDQLYIQVDTTPQTIWFKESGTWTRLTGSTLYADLTSNQTIAGTKTFSSQIQGSISGNAANVTGTVAITNGGTGSTTAGSARAALGAAESGANSDITSLSGLTTALSLSQGGTGATTASAARTSLGLGSAAVLTAGAANGVATLDAGGTVPLSQIPASIQGGVSYQGTWNATTNSPTLTSSVGTKGYYYVVSVAGSTNLNGVTSWNIGDWAIYNGTAWEKIDNTDAVTSVNGYTGTVVLTNTDISGFGTMSTQNANAVAITGGSINGTTIGATTPSTVTGTTVTATTLVVNDNSTLGSSNSDTVTFTARVNSDFDPSTNNAYDLGRNAHAWRNLYLTGTADIAALTASGNVTLSGGTANAVAFLNGSKVLTTGSALTFDGTNFGVGTAPVSGYKAAINGDIWQGNTGGVIIGSIINNGGWYELGGSANVNGLQFAHAATQRWVINSSEQMRLTSTGLGIGTSSPDQKLVVQGSNVSMKVADGTYSSFVATISSANAYGNGSTVGQLYLRGQAGIGFTGNSGGATQMVLDSSGNLGLGVTPSAWGTASSRRAIELPGGGNIWGQNFGGSNPSMQVYCNAYESSTGSRYVNSAHASGYQQNAGTHAWFTAPSGTAGNAISFTQAMTLNASGNLGLGTTTPGCRIDILSPNNTSLDPTIRVNSNNAAVNTALSYDGLVGSNQLTVKAGTSSALIFGSNNTEAARIDTSGNLLVGTTTATARLTVRAATNNINVALVENTTNANGDQALTLGLGTNANNTSSYFLVCQTPSVANRLFIYGNGNVVNTNNSYGSMSDIKLKEKIVDATPKLEKLQQVRVVNYNLIGETQKQIGVIAQELEQIFPGMIDESPDRDKDGNDLGTTTKSVKYSVFVPMLIKAIQEQQALINEQQAALQTLTARVAALESN